MSSANNLSSQGSADGTAAAQPHSHSHHAHPSAHGHTHHHDHATTTTTTDATSTNRTIYRDVSPLFPGDTDGRLTTTQSLLDHKHQDDHGDAVLRKLQRASLLCLVFLLVEVVGGTLAGSLAVLSDAAHLCADLASLAVAMGATYLARMPKTTHHTFGLQRVESLAALLSMLSLALISVGLGVEALRRMYLILWPHAAQGVAIHVEGRLMSGIAFVGVLVNVALAVVLGEHHVHLPSSDSAGCAAHDHGHHHGHEETSHTHDAPPHADETTPLTNVSSSPHDHAQDPSSTAAASSSPQHPMGAFIPFLPQNINLQAAYLHVLGDLAQSVAVWIAGLVIWVQPTWVLVDPLCTLLFCTIVAYSTVGVLRTSVAILLQEVPSSVNWTDMFDRISRIDGVSNVHDLHIWSISHGIPTLSVHCHAVDPEKALSQIYNVCREFGIVHATIQVQGLATVNGKGECITCTDRICRVCEIHSEPCEVEGGGDTSTLV